MLEVTSQARAVLAGAYGGAARAPAVGTDHLLAGLAGAPGTGPAADVLDEADLTGTVLMVLLRRGRHEQVDEQPYEQADGQADQVDGAAGPLPDELAHIRPGRPVHYTAAARTVLHRAVATATEPESATLDSDHLLDALLAVPGTRAAELVRACGADPDRLRDRLRDRLQGTTPPPDGDPLPSDLRSTRDALLGRSAYQLGARRRGRLAQMVEMMLSVVLTEVPAQWVALDAQDRARRQGQRRPGTDLLVVAMLAVHETAHRYPHLMPEDAAHQYAGGAALADAGLTFRTASAAAAEDAGLGTDARRRPPYRRRRAWPGPGWRARQAAQPTGTGELLLAVLTRDDSRAATLLRRTGVTPAAVRSDLRTRLGAGRRPGVGVSGST